MRKLLTAALATLIVGTSLASPTGAFAQPGHRDFIFRKGAGAGHMHRFGGASHFYGGGQNRYAYRSGRGYYGGNYGYRGGYGGYYDDGYDPGAAIAGGIIGLAAGAMLGNALSHGSSVGWCEAHYRSYDPGSRSFLGNDGMRHPCPTR